MILGRVVGEVWSTRKTERLERYKLLVVRPFCWHAPAHVDADHLVAVDTDVDAGVGDDVVVCLGAPPRWYTEGDNESPVDAAVLAVVDGLAMDESAFSGPRPLELSGDGPSNLTIDRIRTEGGL